MGAKRRLDAVIHGFSCFQGTLGKRGAGTGEKEVVVSLRADLPGYRSLVRGSSTTPRVAPLHRNMNREPQKGKRDSIGLCIGCVSYFTS